MLNNREVKQNLSLITETKNQIFSQFKQVLKNPKDKHYN